MKKIIKFTALMMAVILMVLTFAACGSTVNEKDNEVEAVDTVKKYSVTFYADEVPTFLADQVKKSMKIYDSENDVDLGLVTEVLNEDSISYASMDGKLILTTKTGYRSLLITSTVEATESLEGWYVGDVLYGIGHKDFLHVGNTEIELTLRSFEALN